MNKEYEVIVLGTGLKECIISGLLSASGKSVLHLDKNSYYGGESASLNLEDIFHKLNYDYSNPDERLGRSKDYSIDLCPKFIMACGNLVKMLLKADVVKYLEFRTVDGSYVFKNHNVHKMPCTPKEALSTSLMGFFQKRNLKNFLIFVNKFNEKDKNTQYGLKNTMREIFKYFNCDKNTIDFAGHGLALYLDESYLDDPKQTIPFINRCKLYAYSVQKFGSSPYIYPTWGLGSLPESFARLCAVHGGTFMLNFNITEILFDDDGKVSGIKSKDDIAKCKKLICSPSYFGDKNVITYEKIGRWLFIIDHPIKQTNNSTSCQIIIPAGQVNYERKSDIYIAMVSYKQKVAPKYIYIAMISAKIETNDPKKEMAPAVKLIGDYIKDFFFITENKGPSKEFKEKDNEVYMTSSYDATTHFETVTEEVIELYKDITGETIDFSTNVTPEDLND